MKPYKNKRTFPFHGYVLIIENNNKNTDETLQEQKDIPITWGCPNKNMHCEISICQIWMNEASPERSL